jgi:hypothetical protein
MTSRPKSVPKLPFKLILGVSALLLAFAGGRAAGASELSFSPSPAVAGQPITVTFRGHAFACEDQGLLKVSGLTSQRVDLEVTPANCPIIPVGFVEYTASTTIGPLGAGTYIVSVFEVPGSGPSVVHERVTLEVKEPPVCSATDTSLCLGGGRFEVTAEWKDFDDRSGAAHAMPDTLGGLGDWGVLWFFSAENPELLVKILEACSATGTYWVFLSPGSNVEYDVTVRDVKTGAQKTYSNPLGTFPRLTADAQTFPCS